MLNKEGAALDASGLFAFFTTISEGISSAIAFGFSNFSTLSCTKLIEILSSSGAKIRNFFF